MARTAPHPQRSRVGFTHAHAPRQAKWVARVLAGRAPPLPDAAAMAADAAASYEALERAGLPVRYTHCQARPHCKMCCSLPVDLCATCAAKRTPARRFL